MTRIEQDDLFEQNIQLIHYIVSRYWYGYLNDEDFMQECYLKCWKSLDTFNQSKSKLSAYWTTIIANAARMYKRKSTAKKQIPRDIILSLDYTYDHSEENPKDLSDYLFQDNQYILVDLNDLYSRISNMDTTIIELLMAGYTQYEISEITQLTQPNISKHIKKIRYLAKRYLL